MASTTVGRQSTSKPFFEGASRSSTISSSGEHTAGKYCCYSTLTANDLIRFAVENNRVNYPLWPAAGQQIAIANDIDYVFCREN